MLYRARQLGILSEQQYKRALLGHLYAKGERHGENEDNSIPHEKPELLDSAIAILQEKLGFTVDDIAGIARITPALLAQVAPLTIEPVSGNGGVVSLAQFRIGRKGADR
jgi:hypothetical protein